MGFVVLTMLLNCGCRHGETRRSSAKTKSQPAGVAIAPLSKFARCWRKGQTEWRCAWR